MRNVWFALAALAFGCGIPKEQFDAKVLEAEELARKYRDESGKATALEQRVRDLEAKVTALAEERASLESRLTASEGQLTNKEAERRALEEKNAQLAALNEELSKSKKKLAEAKEELEKKSSEYESLAKSLKGEIDAGKIELSELRGKMTVKMKDKILFASGSAKIGKEGQEALDKVAQALAGVRGRIIRVEGHTDDVPTDPKSQFPSNWELSLARAMAVVKHLQDRGVDPTKLSAAGYGPYQPVAPNDSPENKSLNRRIEIVLATATGTPEAPAAAR
ncbi:MAG: OmpA family protein [Myxococcales bacterium]|nr:OmpA family protein [Myxococcales bacterium]